MLTHRCGLVALLAFAAASVDAAESNAPRVRFASPREGREILTKRDNFVVRMSAFDRSARLKTERAISEKEYLAFVAENVLEWTDQERTGLSTVVASVEKRLRALSVTFPPDVVLIKTTGREEGGAAYTRANAIVLPVKFLQTPADWEHLICHELFHVLSRKDAKLRERAYAVIGYSKCKEAVLAPELAPRRITNPDAPRNDHFIKVRLEGKEVAGVPILFARTPTYDAARGGEFFEYLQMQLLVAEQADDLARPTGSRKSVPLEQVSGFHEQIGRNTNYIIHPEEILAENFAHLVLQKRDVPSPEILERLKGALVEAR